MVKLSSWSGIALLGATLVAPPALHAQCSSAPSRPTLPRQPLPGLPTGPSTGSSTPSPASPGPAAPTTPRPAAPTPTTPRGAQAAPATPRSGPRGTPMTFTRRATAKQRLKVDWDYPTPELDDQTLARREALQRIRGEDRRPMLVLRECRACAGTDNALLSRSLGNEKTLTLTRWFHCVKLPNNVLDRGHPFQELFGDEQPPHLFLVSADLEVVVPFDGAQKQGDLWKAMFGLLRRDYDKRPEPSLKALLRLLDAFDALDEKEATLKQQLDRALIAHGATSSQVHRLLAKLQRLQAERAAALAEEQRLADLRLKAAAGA